MWQAIFSHGKYEVQTSKYHNPLSQYHNITLLHIWECLFMPVIRCIRLYLCCIYAVFPCWLVVFAAIRHLVSSHVNKNFQVKYHVKCHINISKITSSLSQQVLSFFLSLLVEATKLCYHDWSTFLSPWSHRSHLPQLHIQERNVAHAQPIMWLLVTWPAT